MGTMVRYMRPGMLRKHSAKYHFVGPPFVPPFVNTDSVTHPAMKIKIPWSTWNKVLHFWIYDCGTRIAATASTPQFEIICVEKYKNFSKRTMDEIVLFRGTTRKAARL
jgi:hypothetical protein